MRRYVMFGHSQLFGDYLDIIRANGDILCKVVQNIPEVVPPGRKSLETLLGEYRASCGGATVAPPIEVMPLERYVPEPGEAAIIGFRGRQVMALRERLVDGFGLRIEPLVHPAAWVSPTVRLSEGTIICAGALVASGVRLGMYGLVNRGASVGHDSELGGFVNIGPGARLAGYVRVGAGAVVGIGAIVIEHVTIGEDAFVGAGAVVTRDVAPRTLVIGMPARKVRDLEPRAGAGEPGGDA